MSRYIDATEIAEQIAKFKKTVNSSNSDYMTGYLSALSVTEGMIANTPTANVVEVVRCKDCKHCRHCYPIKKKNDESREGYYCNPYKEWVTPNGYCSHGERKGK